jgi:hypothetical protein
MKFKKPMTILVACFMGLTILAPAFAEDWVFVDLKPYANAKIINTQWWTGNPGGSDLEGAIDAAAKGQMFDGPGGETVPFNVENANIRLFGTNAASNPKEATGIKVGAAAKVIYFLHMTGWEDNGRPSYKFVMNYQGGGSEELLMQSGLNSDDWCHVPAQLKDDNSAWAWQETGVTCGNVGLIATKWENPQSGKRIETIDIVSLETPAAPGIFAITLGDASLAVAPTEKLAVTWASIKQVSNF